MAMAAVADKPATVDAEKLDVTCNRTQRGGDADGDPQNRQ
jgi:hypothetical protein